LPQTALIVTDMLNAYDHEDADKLAESVAAQLPQMLELRDAARDREDVLLVYVQDNYDAWEVGREQLVDRALKGEHAELVEPIAPHDPVAFIPKGRHSIFYQTALDHVLSVAEVKRVIIIGQVTEQCVLYSALDAYLRGYDVVAPPDAVAHIDDELADAALKMMARNMHADLSPARELFGQKTS